MILTLDRKKTLLKEQMDRLSFSELKEFDKLSEAETAKLNDEVIGKLFKDSINKYEDIDFGDIPQSRGDITKLNSHKDLLASIQLMKTIAEKANKSFTELNVIEKAYNNIVFYKGEFENGFTKQHNLIMLMYNTITLALVHSVSFLISVTVEFVKDPAVDSFEAVMNNMKNRSEVISIDSLEKFNKMTEDGTMNKTFNICEEAKGKQEFLGAATGSAVVSALVLSGLLLLLIPVIRELIYQFYYVRVRFSDYCEIQKEFLESNIQYLNSTNNIDSKKKNDIIKKQKKAVDVFNKLGHFVKIKTTEGNSRAKKELQQNKVNYKELQSEFNSASNNNNIII